MRVILAWLLSLVSAIGATNNVLDWGAIGDGVVTNNQEAFISACTNLHAQGGGTLYIPDGTYILHRPAGRSSAIALTLLTNITFLGESRDGAILKLNPAGAYGTNSDAHMIKLSACSNFAFINLTMDGSRTGFAYHDEQMHGIYLLNSGPVQVTNVLFRELRGDGMFLIGDDSGSCANPPCFTEDILVEDSFFADNGRSGIANQGGLRRIIYEDNLFERTSDQDIDFEPTGVRAGPADVIVRGNRFMHTNATFALTLGGTSASLLSERYTVTNNFINGKVAMSRISGLVFASNMVVLDDQFTDRVITVLNSVTNTVIRDNYIQGTSDYVVYVLPDTINDLTISSNIIRQNGTGRGIRCESAKDGIHIVGNTIRGLTNSTEGISIHTTSNDGLTRTNWSVLGNKIINFALGLRVGTANTATKFSDFTIWDNLWKMPPGVTSTRMMLFKNANDDDDPASTVITTATITCNLCVPH